MPASSPPDLPPPAREGRHTETHRGVIGKAFRRGAGCSDHRRSRRHPGFDITLWQAFFAPAATPRDVVAKLNQEINKLLADPEIKAKLLEHGADVSPLSVDAFAQFVKQEGTKFRGIIKDADLKPQGPAHHRAPTPYRTPSNTALN